MERGYDFSIIVGPPSSRPIHGSPFSFRTGSPFYPSPCRERAKLIRWVRVDAIRGGGRVRGGCGGGPSPSFPFGPDPSHRAHLKIGDSQPVSVSARQPRRRGCLDRRPSQIAWWLVLHHQAAPGVRRWCVRVFALGDWPPDAGHHIVPGAVAVRNYAAKTG
jgi:hypothetical protein